MLWGDFIQVPADVDVEIIGVGLSDPHGIEVEKAWMAPPLDGALGASEYPPLDSPSWDRRVNAVAAHPSPGYNNLVLLLRRSGPSEGTASSMRVDYKVGGVEYSVHGAMSIQMKDDCDLPKGATVASP